MTVLVRIRAGETGNWEALRQRATLAGDSRRIRVGDNPAGLSSIVALRGARQLAASSGVGQADQLSLAEQIGITFKTLLAGMFKFQGVADVAFKGCRMAETELTNGQFAKLLELGPTELAKIINKPQARLEKSLEAVDPGHSNEANDCPMVFLSWVEFEAIAQLLEVRLPNELEWERAAAGTQGQGRVYSFGDQFDKSKVTFDGKGTRSVFAHRDAATPEGVLDLSGNVWEWMANRYGSIDLSDPNNPKLQTNGEHMVLRGGSWINIYPDYLQASNRRFSHSENQFSNFGGRFAKDL